MRISRLISLVVATATLAFANPLFAQSEPPPSPEPTLEDLQQQIAALTKEVLELRAAAAEASTSAKPPVPPIVGAGGTGFTLKSSDGAFLLRIRGYVQSDGRFSNTDTSPSPDTFLLRRVRPVFEATMFSRFNLKLMPDFGQGQTVLQDAYVDVSLAKALNVRTGKFKSPFGLERLASATELTFAERAMPTNLAPNRDLGLMAFGDVAKGILAYQLALVNGVADGASGDLEERNGKDVVARVVARPFARRRDSRQIVGVAAAFSGGHDQGSRTNTGVAVFRTASQQVFFRYRNDATAQGTTVAAGDRLRASLQGYWYSGPAAFTIELTRTHEQVGIGSRVATLDNGAWSAEGSYYVWGKTAARQGGAFPVSVDRARSSAGALELVARITRLNVDTDAFPLFADPAVAASSASEFAIGTNWYTNSAIKLSASFHRTAFGTRDPGGVRRRTENALLTRLQFSF